MSRGAGLATALAAVVDAVMATAPDPRAELDAAAALAEAPGTGPVAAGARRLAAIEMARAAARYQPASYDDAVAIMVLVAGVLDGEITAAGDARQDAAYLALRTLRAAVVADLAARGATLAPLVTIHRAVALPSLVVAQQLYADAARADELVRRVDPVHPAFMPGAMLVLGR